MTVGQAVVIKEGFVAVSASVHTSESAKKNLLAGDECWFMGVARASRARSNFLYFALVIPAFKSPEEWPEPPAAALYLVQLDGIMIGAHSGCETVRDSASRLLVLRGLVATDVTFRSQAAISASLTRAQAALNEEHASSSTRAGKRAMQVVQEQPSARATKRKRAIPDDMQNWGYARLANASTPQLDRVNGLHVTCLFRVLSLTHVPFCGCTAF